MAKKMIFNKRMSIKKGTAIVIPEHVLSGSEFVKSILNKRRI
jgi:hypothetical protein